MDPKSFDCPYCDRIKGVDLEYLRRHCGRGHKVKTEDLYLRLFTDGERPTCACGCGETITQFWGIHKGYSSFILGHHSRLKNNWGHNSEAQEKSQETRRQMHSRGEITIWNRGRTKEDDSRLAAYGKKGSESILANEEELNRRSKMMKEHWEEGRITPLKGPDHSQWKGGVSSLQQLCRANLFRAWSRPIMVRDNFTCQRCGQQHDLCVHHDGQRFADILQLAMQHFGHDDARELTSAQKDELSEWIISHHAEHGITGITLCEGCHGEEHVA